MTNYLQHCSFIHLQWALYPGQGARVYSRSTGHKVGIPLMGHQAIAGHLTYGTKTENPPPPPDIKRTWETVTWTQDWTRDPARSQCPSFCFLNFFVNHIWVIAGVLSRVATTILVFQVFYKSIIPSKWGDIHSLTPQKKMCKSVQVGFPLTKCQWPWKLLANWCSPISCFSPYYYFYCFSLSPVPIYVLSLVSVSDPTPDSVPCPNTDLGIVLFLPQAVLCFLLSEKSCLSKLHSTHFLFP